jgi:DNA-binding NarL/FixJ family response regulator
VIGKRTAEMHVSHLLAKLDLASRAQVAVWAVERGLLEDDDAPPV